MALKGAPALDVAVVGGGVAGLCSAALFAAHGARVVVIASELRDAVPSGAIEARNYAISPASMRLLDAAGAQARLDAARLGTFRRMAVWDEGSGAALEFLPPPAHDGAMGWIIEHQNLVAALLGVLRERGVEIIEDTLEQLECGPPARLELGGGRALESRLLVGADGVGSRVREAAAIQFIRRPYAQRALVANVVTEQPHDDIARQRFLSTGPLAFLPLAAACESSIVWSCDNALADELECADDALFAARLEQAFEARLGGVVAVGPRSSYMLERAAAMRWFRGACVLVGDAAHVVHPLAGQGLNLGLMDVAALVEILAADRNAAGWPRRGALRRYERWRKSEAQLLRAVTDGLQRLFARTERPLSALRGLGLRATDSIEVFKVQLAARAMGVSGDLPLVVRNSAGSDAAVLSPR